MIRELRGRFSVDRRGEAFVGHGLTPQADQIALEHAAVLEGQERE